MKIMINLAWVANSMLIFSASYFPEMSMNDEIAGNRMMSLTENIE